MATVVRTVETAGTGMAWAKLHHHSVASRLLAQQSSTVSLPRTSSLSSCSSDRSNSIRSSIRSCCTADQRAAPFGLEVQIDASNCRNTATPRTTCLSLSQTDTEGCDLESFPLSPRTIVRSCVATRSRECSDASTASDGGSDGDSESGALVSSYDYYGTVGRGSFGMVALVHQTHGHAVGRWGRDHGGRSIRTFAVKVCSKGTTRRQLEVARREARILRCLESHPFIVEMAHCAEDESNIYMALEYCMGGDLFTHLRALGTLPERAARHIVAELALALSHLHADGIMHRDVKPENVLLDGCGHVRLADFGLATTNVSRPDGGAMSVCGSPGYIAPEVLAGRGYGLAADWWQLGMLLLEVTTGHLPWTGTSLSEVARALRTVPLRLPPFLTADARDFLRLVLSPHPSMRLGSLGSAEVRRHAFFNGLCWGKLERRELPAPFNPCSPAYRTRRGDCTGGRGSPSPWGWLGGLLGFTGGGAAASVCEASAEHPVICGHGAPAAQALASGEPPQCRVEVTRGAAGALNIAALPAVPLLQGSEPPQIAAAP